MTTYWIKVFVKLKRNFY